MTTNNGGSVEPKTLVAGVRLSPEEMAAVDRLAARMGLTRSLVLRVLVRTMMAADDAVENVA